jgi:uncharacterized protein YjbI with pentapeptide repeats
LIFNIKAKIVTISKKLISILKSINIVNNWHLFFYIFAGLCVAIYLYCYISPFNQTEWNGYLSNIHVELAGAFFDIVLFGIIFYTFQFLFQKKEKIVQLSEQLDDFRDWDEKEAGYRVIGILKRLHKLGVNNVDLSRCHFNGINIISEDGRIFVFDFKSADLTNVTFTNIKLNNAKFDNVCGNIVANYADFSNDPRTIFTNCNLRNPSFSNNTFHFFNFIGTTLKRSKVIDSQFNYAQFSKCIFDDIKFDNVIFRRSVFQNMDIATASYTNVKFVKCTFENCISPDSNESILFEECEYK